MKLTIVAFIAGLCVVAVAANAAGDLETIYANDVDGDVDIMLDDFIDDIEPETFTSGLYWVLKKTLRTVKGVNCAIKGAVNMKNAAQKFIDDVESCGVAATKQVQAVVNSCYAVISTTNDILNVNQNICNNSSSSSEGNDGQKTGSKCFWKLLKKFMTLKKQVQKAVKQIKSIPTIGTGANSCVTTAANELTVPFTGFPTFVQECSKLK